MKTALLAALSLSACATGPAPSENRLSAAERVHELSQFAPRPNGTERTIDYTVIDEFLGLVVLDVGPSTRKRMKPPTAPAGTRLPKGHDSPVRLEGNKVAFSEFNDAVRQAVREYAESLELIGNRIAIEDLPRNEQLAYWFNLHNITLIAELAERYPVYEPSRLRIDGVLLHDAKLVEIDGVALSLRDIREGIVYPHWDDPRVIYGFWHGDLASPSIRGRAWTSASLDRDLTANAQEFINGLRGVDGIGRGQLGVSPIYREARAELFPQWPTDLRAHINQHAFVPVARLMREDRTVVYLPYEMRIADLAGGEPYPGPRPGVEALSGRNFDGISPSVRGLLTEMVYKFNDPGYWSQRRATVTIIDGDAAVDERGAEID